MSNYSNIEHRRFMIDKTTHIREKSRRILEQKSATIKDSRLLICFSVVLFSIERILCK